MHTNTDPNWPKRPRRPASHLSQYRRWLQNRITTKPGAPLLFIDDQIHPLWWFRKGDFISLHQLMHELHCGYNAMLRILGEEEIHVYRKPAGLGHYCYVSRERVPYLMMIHGNQIAREQRKRLWRSPYSVSLKLTCPYCGSNESQHRVGKPRCNGNQPVKCWRCGRGYTHEVSPKRPPLNCPCPRCGATVHQHRLGFSATGKRIVRCWLCGRRYRIPNPDPIKPPPSNIIRSAPSPDFVLRQPYDLW